MKSFLKKWFHYYEPNDPEAIIASTHEIMMSLNQDFSPKAQNEIIVQVISNTIQLRELEIKEKNQRVKDLTEGNNLLKTLSNRIS